LPVKSRISNRMKLSRAIALFISLFFAGAAAANFAFNGIQINGNQRIEAATIESYLDITPGEFVSQKALNESLKKLYATGFFADVRLQPRGDVLQVNVVENPSINQLAFEGNDAISNEDLEREVTLRPRAIYTRPAVQTDVRRLLDIYRRSGYYSVHVVPKIIQQAQNRVDLVFEIEEGIKAPIRNITFLGQKAYSSSTLEGVIRSEESRFYKFLSDNDKYDPDRLEYDKELLRRFYRSEGYADFKVKSAFAELSPSRDAFYLTFTVDEGARYRFGEVETESALADGGASLQESILTKSGDLFNANDIETSIDEMIETLGDRGFAFVEIDPVLDRNEETKTIDLTYSISQGPRVYVERININGNISTLESVVRREFRLVENDAYSSSKLRRSEQRLKNLGYFKDVQVNTSRGSAPDKVVIDVNVEEQSTGEISLGAGFSSVDGPLADVGITERNLLGRGQNLRLRVLAAAERQQFDIGFTEPYMFGRELTGGVDLYQTRQDFSEESSFDRESTGGRLRTGYKLSEKISHQLYYSYEQTQITDVDSNASRFIRDQEGENTTSLIGHNIAYDDRDNRFAPTSGVLLRGIQEFAGLGGDDEFVRHEFQSEYYYTLWPEVVLGLAAAGGHVQPLSDDVRINQRFFVGGRVLRGFDNSGIGPRDSTTGDALGGNLYYIGSVETRFPLGLPDDLGITGALFTDVGSLWDVDDSGPEVVGNNHIMRASVGFGIAWASPFGPIRVDLSMPFLKEDYDITERIRLNFGTRF
jgi:outer membrane protein insertion porin family